ncbi:MAG: competence protein ComEA [Dehalococcoidales bacterium]|nr:competence protein ComEA [Dehalococcoidales bacterium]
MKENKIEWFWTLVIIALLIIITGGGTVAWLRYRPAQPIEISLPQGEDFQGKIYIDGAVTIPGVYPFTTRDNIEALIQAAGGAADSANLSGLKLYLPRGGEDNEPQKIDINRAEVWLLSALPEIGDKLAQRIVDYRQQNGPFRRIDEIARVAGIGEKTYEKIKPLITVSD